MPSTMQALRTRIYSSTLYILLTSLRVGFDPMESDRRYSFQLPQSGCRAAYMVHFISAFYSNADGTEEVVPIYPRDYEIRKFRNFSLTREAIESQQTLEEFLREQITAGKLSCLSMDVVDLDARRQGMFKDYSETITLTPQGWFSNKVIGRGLTLWEKFILARKNRRIRSSRD